MSNPENGKEQMSGYQKAGCFGCLPSLLCFLVGIAGSQNIQILLFSFVFGLGGVIGLIVAAIMRDKNDD